MKIRFKGLAKLLKAVPNRAHLFPVKVLVNGKNKSFYAIRYKTGNKAMEIVLKQMRIPNDREALFDSKDGKAKNLSEKEVLAIYSKAGKPGSLNEFIQANFKKPIIKPRNSSLVDLGDKQMSIDDLMNQQKGGEKKETEQPSPYGNLSKYQFKRLQQKGASLWESHGKRRIYFNNLGVELARKVNEARGGRASDNFMSLVGNKLYYDLDSEKFSTLVDNPNSDDFLQDLFKEARETIDGLKEEEKTNPKDLNRLTENPNLTASQEKTLLEKLGVDVDLDDINNRTSVEPDRKVIEELIGKKYDKINGEKLSRSAASRVNETLYGLRYDVNTNEVIVFTKDNEGIREMVQKAIDKLIEDIKSNDTGAGNEQATQDQEPQEEKLENANGNEENKPTTDELEANEKITQYKNHLESKESDIDIDKVSGNLVRETTAIDYSNAKKNILKFIDKNSQVSNRADLEHIVGAGVRNLDNVKKIIETVDDDGFWNGYRDFKAQRPNLLEKQGVNSLIVYYNEYSKNNKQEATQGQEPQETKLEFRNVGLNGGLINLILMREGTTRVESKNEYKEVKNIEGLIKQIEPLKDSHTKIKGRAIMDMLGIDADLYSRAGNIPFPTGSIGYCTKLYNKETGECQISEIGLVADRDNPAAETKTAIHECMHARIGLAGKSNLLDLSFGSDTKSSKLADRIEESLVEMAGQAIAHKVHGKEANQLIHSYSEAIVSVLPNIWDSDIFKKSRKNGLLGIGMEIAKRITSKDTNFLNEMVSKNQNVDKDLHSKRINAIESKIKDRSDKVDKIQNDTGVSGIASLVEELKRGTISLEGALNSSKYRELAAVLITKFLEDEDIDALEQLALSF